MAIEAKYVELINTDLDGEIGDAERVELAAYLEANPDAQAMRAELADLCGTLDAMAPVEPPTHLKYAIMDSLKKPTARRPAQAWGWRRIFAAPVLRHTVAFAAGSVLTFALFSSNQISDQAFDDVTGLVGTISETVPTEAGQGSINLTSSEIAGTVSVHNAGTLKVIEFNLSAEGPVEIVASFSNLDLWFKGFAQLENNNASIVADEGVVRMRMQGRNRYAMYLQHASSMDAPVSLKFFAAGDLIHEATLTLSTEGEITE
jgi:hypothetical protein